MGRLSARHVVWLVADLAATGLLVYAAIAPRAPRVITPAIPYDGESWFVLQRAYPTGRMPPIDALDRAMRVVHPGPAPRPQFNLPGDRWTSVGPQPIFVSGSTPTSFAGRVTAIAPHPTIATTLYIGTDDGGIWRTTDGGTTWASLLDSVPVPAIQSLAIDPVNPQLLYATTVQRTYGTRWLQSTDGGSSWNSSSIVADGLTLSPALCSVNIMKACIPPSSGRIIIDPTRAGSPNTTSLYYVGTSHLLRSDDSGRTFHSVLSLPIDLDFGGPDAATQHPDAPYLRDAAIDPVRPSRLFAVVAQPHCLDQACATMNASVMAYRSFDGGAHWDQRSVATLDTYTPAVNVRYADPGAVYVPRARAAVAPSNTDVVAIAFRDLNLQRPRVVTTQDAGDHWAESAQVTNSLTWPLGLVFSPTDSNTIYVSSNGVYRTTNGGQTWTGLGPFHSDNVFLAFDANRQLLVGGDGGLYRNSTGTTLVPQHAALAITEFYSIATHPTNGLLFAGGTQDNGTAVFQGSLGWNELVGGDGGDVVFDPNPQNITVYAEVEWYFDQGTNVFDFFRCQPATGCAVRSTGIDKSLNGPFTPRFALDASTPATLWLTAEKMFRTDNNGDSWTAMSPAVSATQRCWQDPVKGPLCASGGYFAAATVAPNSSQVVYAGALNGDVWLTTNRGATWTSIAGPNAGPLPVRNVNDIVVDPLDSRIAYVAYSGFDSGGSGRGHFFRTTNAGQTWQDLTGSLPDLPVNTILIDPDSVSSASSSRVVYIGTDIGVFRSTLDGNWQPFGSGLPPVVVNRLAYNATTHQLLAATYGRGVWAISSRFTR